MRNTSATRTEATCPHCGRPLPTFTIPALHGKGTITIHGECDCEAAVSEERDAARRERQDQLSVAWGATGVPKRYRDVAPDPSLLDRLRDGGGLYLCGPRGTGKTTAACAALKAYVARNTSRATGWCSARFVSAPAWLDRMKDAYDRRGASADEEFGRAAGTGLLVLDDIGKFTSRVTDWAVGKLFRLVDERYSEERPTVFTSQYDLAGLSVRLTVGDDSDTPDAIVSRIFETCEQRRFDGPDRRLSRN